ncbi:sugar ABC transporter [Paraburkholderia kururiensis]|uniref:sugar ABC transporter n=1 Tax=Paraburkholderia kururiensis TaxID=984307 RepID=UPI0018F68DE4|nr:sugar ABC transporter [Paraburkholderia kururiensis]
MLTTKKNAGQYGGNESRCRGAHFQRAAAGFSAAFFIALAVNAVPSRVLAQEAQVTAAGGESRAHASTQESKESPRPNIAFFDGADPPVDLLQAFDAVVLDPSRGFDPAAHPLPHTLWLARTDTANAGTQVLPYVESLWQKGYRGFLLDTPAAVEAFDAIHAAHPEARLIIGGSHPLQAARPHAGAAGGLRASAAGGLYAVVGGSLVKGGASADNASTDNASAGTTDQPPTLGEARAFTEQTGVPVISIDYCQRTDRACARDTAAKALAAGVLPYATDPARDIVGIGAIEVLPRKVLVVQDRDPKANLDITPGVDYVSTPLNYLGYDVEFADFNAPLPRDVTPDRYAGVVVWITGNSVPNPVQWERWLGARIADHVKVAVFGHFGFDAANDMGPQLDLQPVAGRPAGALSVVVRDPMMGFEVDPRADPRDLAGLRAGAKSRPLLRLSAGDGVVFDQAAITPWGGFTLDPYAVYTLDAISQDRWAINPMAFLKDALRLSPMPSPNVTTENGRRLFMSHVDGDGFASRTEFPGPDFSGEALYERIFTKYKVPMTLSVIEGEVGPAGLHPDISPRLEQIARKMFALPYVEIGSHTYSHPFRWDWLDLVTGKRIDNGESDDGFSLNIPGYKFNIDREITGTIDYINSRLAPPGKRTMVLQWPGDCQPPGVIVRKVYAAHVYNINGGDTIITKSAPSWTNIAPIGVEKGTGPDSFQLYAPNQDENVYTNDWLGPFYGFTRVLETFDMTDRPYRFKPIDVYYHMYSGTKIASLRALDQIFAAVLKQPVLPVHITDYARKALDWRTFAVAREVDGSGWRVRGNGEVRELRWPQTQAPDLATATGVTGYSDGPDGTYVHIDGGSARFAFEPAGTQSGTDAGPRALPYIAEANGFVRNFRRTANGMTFDFGGYYEPFVRIANGARCTASVAGRAVAARRDGSFLRFDTPGVAGETVDYQPVSVTCGN